jgi:hypothetical protein
VLQQILKHTLTRAGEISALPLERIRAVEVNEGVNLARGIVRGAAAGAVVGALAFVIDEVADPSESDFVDLSRREAIFYDALVGGLWGALVGIPIGVVVEKRQWSLAWSSRTR